ncbi:MAG TPA: hypothetical protein VJO53_10810 [Candidatus Acidoferrales bacterium]|nr:hypothetical protein [Candidatus Acidoferrales bacterium]
MALAGNRAAAEILFDRAYGRPKVTAEFAGRDPLAELLAEMDKVFERIGPPEEQIVQ